LAGIYRDIPGQSESRDVSPNRERKGKLAYFKNRELQMLVRKLDLPSKGNQVKIKEKYYHEELLRTPLQ
jgi:hypothetical protein